MERASEQYVRNKITVISFMLSIILVQAHAYNIIEYGVTAESKGWAARLVYIIETHWLPLRPMALSMFFAISGFLFFRTFEWSKLGTKYLSRIRSILIPYIIWDSFYYFVFALLKKIPGVSEHINNSGEISFTGWIRALCIDEYYTLWFLKLLIIYIALAPVFAFLLKDIRGIPTGAILIAVLIVIRCFGYLGFFRGIECYAIGAWIGLNHKDTVYIRNRALGVTALLLIAGLVILPFDISHIAVDAALIPVVWFAADGITADKPVPVWMGYTFVIYVAHDIFLETYKKLLYMTCGTGPVALLAGFIVLPLLAVATVIITAIIMKKICPRVWGVLSGGR